MKKVLAAALLCAVSAFATWDYFPIKDAGKGEGKVGVAYGVDNGQFGINAKARFSIISGLEAYLSLGSPAFVIAEENDATGIDYPVIGVRYWLPMGLGFFADVNIPALRADERGGAPALGFYAGAQFSTKLSDALELGSELGVTIPTEKDNYTEGMDLKIGVELDISLGTVTPLVGVDVELGLSKNKMEVEMPIIGTVKTESDREVGITPFVGVIIPISDMLAADVVLSYNLGKRYDAADTPLTIEANLSINF